MMRSACLVLLLGPSIALGQQPTASFPRPYNSEPGNPSPPMTADQAAGAFRLPEGFRASVVAAEPDVQNPIACAWDAKGRLWVAENYTYAERALRFDMGLRDRVLILELDPATGKMVKRSVFTDDVQALSGIEIGKDGIWLICPPQLLFIPMKDDKPSGPAEVVLDGFTVAVDNYHNFANGLRWGPDGWLYGRCGASSPGDVGAPGTPTADRVPLRGGVWRYHPGRKVFEALAHGTTNPWGHDWNDKGELFFINTVMGHLWHGVAGMHLGRSHTIDPNPLSYRLIDQHADHYHWDHSKDWTDSRNVTGEHDARGGGHAHCGMIVYDGTNWPESYRGKLMTLNLHGRRINVDRLDRQGSGYVGKHEPDIVFAGDPWFRPIELTVGPYGDVFLLDWSDTGECHENNGVHRLSGRIYRIRYGDDLPGGPIDLDSRTDLELIAIASGDDHWKRKQALRLLVNRAPASPEARDWVAGRLQEAADGKRDGRETLNAIWIALCLDLAEDNRASLVAIARHKDESARAWAIRALVDRRPIDTVMGKRPADETELDDETDSMLIDRAVRDPSGLVRLVLASTLQRLPHGERAVLAMPLVEHADDADDHNLPLMVWHGLMPMAESNPKALAVLARSCTWPLTGQLIARSLAESIRDRPEPVAAIVRQLAAGQGTKGAPPIALLDGLAEGLKGLRKADKPDGWDDASAALAKSADPAVQERVRELGVVFGDGRALDEVRKLALDDKAELELRRSALASLIEARPDDLRAICERLLRVRYLNTTAVRGLALFDDPAIGRSLAESYHGFQPWERSAVLDTLVSRPSFAASLLDAMAAGRVPRDDLGAFRARQIRGFGNDDLTAKLSQAWGELRDSDADKKANIVVWKDKLSPESLARADRSRGRQAFDKVCSTCHVLYGQGKTIGPDLTGSGRDNLDYLLENILDPSAVVTADYRMTAVATDDGRVFNGIVKNRNDRTLTLQLQNEVVTLDRSAIAEEKATPASLMPDGVLNELTEDQVRDLFAYLQTRTQVPLPASSQP